MALKIRVVEGPKVTTSCGGAILTVEWKLNANDSGFVIQHVTFVWGDFDCDGQQITKPRKFEYYEAWEVKSGVVYAGRASAQTKIDGANGTDFYVLPDEGNGTEGTNRIEGKVKFLPNFNLPKTFKRQKEGFPAGSLPASRTAPPGWNDAGAADHMLEVKWCCCPGRRIRPTVTGTPVAEASKMKDDQTTKGFPRNRVARIIRDIPAWAPARRVALEEIQKKLQPLGKFSLSDVRRGMEVYLAHSVSKEHYGVEEMARLFLVNRYVLAIPEQIPVSQNLAFGGWIIPAGESATSLWPFSLRRGRLQLTERFRGYAGPPYDALGEFDHFVGYGPRWGGKRRGK